MMAAEDHERSVAPRMGGGLGLGSAARTYTAPEAAPAAVQPLVLIDFKNGVYEIQGVTKTLAEVVTESVDWSPFDPAHVVAGTGLVPPASGSTGPLLTAACSALLAGGCVAVMTCQLTGTEAVANGIDMTRFDLPGFLTYQELACYIEGTAPAEFRAGLNTTTLPAQVLVATAASYKVAAKYDDTQVAVAVSGEGPSTGVAEAPQPATDFGIYAGQNGSGVVVVEKIEFYSLADYDTADLVTLSTV